MDFLFEILGKVSEVSVTVGAAAKALIAFIGGFIASKKLPKPEDKSKE